MPSGIDSAVAMAGAMNVIDWNRTPLKLTAPRFSAGAPPVSAVGTSDVIAWLLPQHDGLNPESTRQSRARRDRATTSRVVRNSGQSATVRRASVVAHSPP